PSQLARPAPPATPAARRCGVAVAAVAPSRTWAGAQPSRGSRAGPRNGAPAAPGGGAAREGQRGRAAQQQAVGQAGALPPGPRARGLCPPSRVVILNHSAPLFTGPGDRPRRTPCTTPSTLSPTRAASTAPRNCSAGPGASPC